MVKKSQPQAEPTAEAPEVSTEPAPAISFEEPAAQLAEGAVISDEKPADFVEPVIDPKLLEALQREAHNENQKRDFTRKVLEARNPPPPPEVPQATLAPRIVEQTNAELAAGRALVEKNEALAAARRPHVPQPEETGSKPVFRPADYVPDQKKGQGNVQARTL